MGSFLRCRLKLHPRGALLIISSQDSILNVASWLLLALGRITFLWFLGEPGCSSAPSVLAFVLVASSRSFFDKTGPLQPKNFKKESLVRILPIIHRTLFNKAITCAIHPCMAALFFAARKCWDLSYELDQVDINLALSHHFAQSFAEIFCDWIRPCYIGFNALNFTKKTGYNK